MLSRWVIQFFLQLERTALTISGRSHVLGSDSSAGSMMTGAAVNAIRIRRQPRRRRNHHEPDEDNINEADDDLEQEPLSQPQQTYHVEPSWFCLGILLSMMQRIVWSVVLGGTMALLMIYYWIHFKVTTPTEQQGKMETSLILEWIMFPIILSFPLQAPLHQALGCCGGADSSNTTNSHSGSEQRRARRAIRSFQQDADTRRLIHWVLWFTVQYTLGEVTFFWKLFAIPEWNKMLYAGGALAKISFIYSSLLYATLVARAILMRLEAIHQQVRTLLSHWDQQNSRYNHHEEEEVSYPPRMLYNYATFPREPEEPSGGDPASPNNDDDEDEPQVMTLSRCAEEWKRSYEMIRHDMQHVCHYQSWGSKLLLVIFLVAVDTTSMILTFYEQLSEHLTVFNVTCLLVSYTANATVISLTVSNLAYIPTKCQVHIGAQMNLLTMTRHENDDDTTTTTNGTIRLDRLVTGFLWSPVRFHVGNFELGPESANTMLIWFVGLFLYVFGLNAPGIE